MRTSVSSTHTGLGYEVTYDRTMPSGAVFEGRLFARYMTRAAAEAGADRLRNGPLAERVSNIQIDEVEITTDRGR